jgi:hypothetical protein
MPAIECDLENPPNGVRLILSHFFETAILHGSNEVYSDLAYLSDSVAPLLAKHYDV